MREIGCRPEDSRIQKRIDIVPPRGVKDICLSKIQCQYDDDRNQHTPACGWAARYDQLEQGYDAVQCVLGYIIPDCEAVEEGILPQHGPEDQGDHYWVDRYGRVQRGVGPAKWTGPVREGWTGARGREGV